MLRVAALPLLLAIAACSFTEPVLMRHPDGRVATCGPYDNRGMQSAAAALRESQCISDYQRQGYERAPE